ILGSFSLMQFLFSPLWGRLSDRIGRRPVLMISLFGNVLGFTCFAFANNVAMLFATRIISGIASASIPAAQAYIADTADEANRAKEMGRISMAFGLGLVLGPPLGGLLSSFGTDMHLRPNVLPGAAALVAGLLLVPLFLISLLIVAVCLMGIAQGTCHPALSAYISKVAPAEHRGGILGVSSSMTALARVVGPALAGFAYDSYRAGGAVGSQVVIVVVGVVLLVRLMG